MSTTIGDATIKVVIDDSAAREKQRQAASEPTPAEREPKRPAEAAPEEPVTPTPAPGGPAPEARPSPATVAPRPTPQPEPLAPSEDAEPPSSEADMGLAPIPRRRLPEAGGGGRGIGLPTITLAEQALRVRGFGGAKQVAIRAVSQSGQVSAFLRGFGTAAAGVGAVVAAGAAVQEFGPGAGAALTDAGADVVGRDLFALSRGIRDFSSSLQRVSDVWEAAGEIGNARYLLNADNTALFEQSNAAARAAHRQRRLDHAKEFHAARGRMAGRLAYAGSAVDAGNGIGHAMLLNIQEAAAQTQFGAAAEALRKSVGR